MIRDDVAHAVPVTAGQQINDDVELQGVPAAKGDDKVERKGAEAVLKVGDRIVLKPPANLEDVKRVSIIQK